MIAIFYDDHNPPHFHARYDEHKASLGIENLAIMEGSLPPRVVGLVTEWALNHKEKLSADWDRARRQQPLLPIGPLK